jgi:hypothetical protein
MRHIFPEKNLELAGLISCGGRTHAIFYRDELNIMFGWDTQMEVYPTLEEWLEKD